MERAAAEHRSIDWWWMISTAGMTAMLVFFAWVHFSQWRMSGRPVGLGLMVQESVTAALFVVRRRPAGTSRSLTAWVAGTIGSFGMLASRPADGAAFGLEPVWLGMQIVGVALATLGLLCLGRSFGVVAANRGVQTGGAYGIVRHPVYAAYLVTHIAYLLENPSIMNALIMVVVYGAQLVRIAKEEEFLSADPAYVAYRGRVRYRLVPFLY